MTATITAWYLIIGTLVYSQDEGTMRHAHYLRDQAYASKQECEDARYKRVHGDTYDADLETACVQVSFEKSAP